MGALGSLLPSPPTSLTHVPSLYSLLCQIALKSAFSPAFLFSLHIFPVGRLSGLVLSSACHKIPLLKSCSEQELVFCSVNEAFLFLSTGKLHEHTVPCETLQTQTQHIPFSFPGLCNTPAQLLSLAMLPAGLDVNGPVLQAPLLSTNMKQHNSRVKLFCYQ